MTLPPCAWIAAMSLPKAAWEIGCVESPFQYAVQEPVAAVWRNAIVRYLLPDSAASAAGLSPVHASKYGAATCAGMGLAVCEGVCCAATAPPPPRAASPADRVVTVALDSNARSGRRGPGRLIDAPMVKTGRRGQRGDRTENVRRTGTRRGTLSDQGRTATIVGLDQYSVKVLYG